MKRLEADFDYLKLHSDMRESYHSFSKDFHDYCQKLVKRKEVTAEECILLDKCLSDIYRFIFYFRGK